MLGLPGMRRAPRMKNPAKEIVEILQAMLPEGDLLSPLTAEHVKLFMSVVELPLLQCSRSPRHGLLPRWRLLRPRAVECLPLLRVQRLLLPLRLLSIHQGRLSVLW